MNLISSKFTTSPIYPEKISKGKSCSNSESLVKYELGSSTAPQLYTTTPSLTVKLIISKIDIHKGLEITDTLV